MSEYVITDQGRIDIRLRRFRGQAEADLSDDPVARRTLAVLKHADRPMRRTWLLQVLSDPPPKIDAALRRLLADGEVITLGRGAWAAHGARAPEVWPLPPRDPETETAERILAAARDGHSYEVLSDIAGEPAEPWLKSLRQVGRLQEAASRELRKPDKNLDVHAPTRKTATAFRALHGGLGSETACAVLWAHGELTRAEFVDALLHAHPDTTRAEALLAIGCAQEEGVVRENFRITAEGGDVVLRLTSGAGDSPTVGRDIRRLLGGIVAARAVPRREIARRCPAGVRVGNVISTLSQAGYLEPFGGDDASGHYRLTRSGCRQAVIPESGEVEGLSEAQRTMLRLVRHLSPVSEVQLHALAVLAPNKEGDALGYLLRQGWIAFWDRGYGVPDRLERVDLGRPGTLDTAWRGAFGVRGLPYAVALLRRLGTSGGFKRFRDIARSLANVRKLHRVLRHLSHFDLLDQTTTADTGLHLRVRPERRWVAVAICDADASEAEPTGTSGPGIDEMTALALAACLDDPAADDIQQGLLLMGLSPDAGQVARRLVKADLASVAQGRVFVTDRGAKLASVMIDALGRRSFERTRDQLEGADAR